MPKKGVTKARRKGFELQSSELWGQQKRSERTTSNSIDRF